MQLKWLIIFDMRITLPSFVDILIIPADCICPFTIQSFTTMCREILPEDNRRQTFNSLFGQPN